MKTILIVEDDEDLRDVLVETLRSPGRTIRDAENGRVALEIIERAGLPDLILLDMNMPVMNGWKLAEELRARHLWRVPVIVLTAAYDAARNAREIGAAGHLGKPFSTTGLSALVAEHLERQFTPERAAIDETRELPVPTPRV
jgi:CheY-like chemotaxis protein